MRRPRNCGCCKQSETLTPHSGPFSANNNTRACRTSIQLEEGHSLDLCTRSPTWANAKPRAIPVRPTIQEFPAVVAVQDQNIKIGFRQCFGGEFQREEWRREIRQCSCYLDMKTDCSHFSMSDGQMLKVDVSS